MGKVGTKAAPTEQEMRNQSLKAFCIALFSLILAVTMDAHQTRPPPPFKTRLNTLALQECVKKETMANMMIL